MTTGLILFTISIAASLFWLRYGGIEYIIKNRDSKDKNFLDLDTDEEDKNQVL